MSGSDMEARRVKRRPTKAMAAAALEGELLFQCHMLDVSDAGARLSFKGKSCPDRFQLIDVAAGVAYSVRVVWRRAGSVGVAFLHSRSVDDASTAAWLVELWRALLADPALERFEPAA